MPIAGSSRIVAHVCILLLPAAAAAAEKPSLHDVLAGTVLERRAADILNPDVCNCGGILELREIGAMAEAYHVAMSPHNYNSTTVGLAATLHASAGMPNFIITEYFVNFAEVGAEVDSRDHKPGPLAQQTVDGQVDAVGGGAVHCEPAGPDGRRCPWVPGCPKVPGSPRRAAPEPDVPGHVRPPRNPRCG